MIFLNKVVGLILIVILEWELKKIARYEFSFLS